MIRTADDGKVRVITLDRPNRRNAVTPDGLEQLEAAVTGTSAPVIYLHGAGEAFCAGADLDVVAALDPEEAVAFARRGQQVANAIAATDSIVVAGIDGPARGGGVEFALACDVRIATPAATFGEPGVTLGLFGTWGGTVRLPRIVGLGEAMDFALSGRVVDADEALRMGLVSRIVDEPRAVAREIAANDPAALVTVKHRLRDTDLREKQEAREAEAFKGLIDANAAAIAADRASRRSRR